MFHSDITMQLESIRILFHVITHSYDIYLLMQMVGLNFVIRVHKGYQERSCKSSDKVLGTSLSIFLPCISPTVLFLAMLCIPQTEFMCHVYNVFMLSYAKPQILPFVLQWTPRQWPGSAETWEVYWKVVGVNSYNAIHSKVFISSATKSLKQQYHETGVLKWVFITFSQRLE
jgi:hypothetical protein